MTMFRRTGRGSHVHTPDQTINPETGEETNLESRVAALEEVIELEGGVAIAPTNEGNPVSLRDSKGQTLLIVEDDRISLGANGDWGSLGTIWGQFEMRSNVAPADADVTAGQIVFWFDKTHGAAKLKIKGRDADGAIVTGEVDLT